MASIPVPARKRGGAHRVKAAVQPLSGRPISNLARWKLEDAKSRFSEVVRLASSEGPQLVTVRGKEAAIILDPETYRQLLPAAQEQLPLVEFLQSLNLSRIDTEREKDYGREIDFGQEIDL